METTRNIMAFFKPRLCKTALSMGKAGRTLLGDRRGVALVAVLLFIVALTLTASVIVWVVGSERRASHNDYAHLRALYASDAGSERAINWIRVQELPPPVVEIDQGSNDQYVVKEENYTYLDADNRFRMDIKHKLTPGGSAVIRPRPGWDESWADFEYVIDSYGHSVSKSNTRVEVRAARLYRVDYSY